MPLYFGLPVICEEAFRLFGLNFEEAKCEIMDKYKLTKNMYMDCHFVDRLNRFFEAEEMVMRVFYTDKGQCVIGYEMKEVSVFQRKYIDVSKFMTILTTLKSLFSKETDKWRANFAVVTLEIMEDEPETVREPEPYIIEFNH
jgi:hypothetical protein